MAQKQLLGYKFVPSLDFGVQMGYMYPEFIPNIKIKESCQKTTLFRKKSVIMRFSDYYLLASSTATAHATVIPTMGLLPAPIRPIISTCAGTEDEPAN